ncbi:MAG: biotin--[acetyl-CoA-carboxylase] ligase [Dehalococcoidia bacterium]|nr:biotin--[acetyl-CoA-carboxylase] ligase [Dehalococcoidia bacterium]
MRYSVLRALRNHTGDISGEVISGELGISRVAVWKQVQELRKQGYVIAASSRGYRLESAPDALLPGEFPGWESLVRHFESVESTMGVARTLARSGAEAGTLVLAEQQSSGRGRLDRSWMSPPGGIYMTLVTRPSIAPVLAPRISLMASVAVAEAIHTLLGLPAQVKWPNDVLIEDRKVCGILAEMEAESDAVRYVNIGIGLNANTPVGELQQGAVSLAEASGAPVDRVLLVRSIVEGIFARIEHLEEPSILDEWRRWAVTLGREVSIISAGAPVRGVAMDISSMGTLMLRQPNGEIREIVAGDCRHEAQ